jgi:hypothetical protein
MAKVELSDGGHRHGKVAFAQRAGVAPVVALICDQPDGGKPRLLLARLDLKFRGFVA